MQISRHAWVEIQKWYGWRPTNKEPVTQRPCMGGDPEIKDLSLTQTDVERSVMQISRQVSTWTPWFCPVTVQFFWTCEYEYTLPLFKCNKVHLDKPVRLIIIMEIRIASTKRFKVRLGFVQLQSNSSGHASTSTPCLCSVTVRYI